MISYTKEFKQLVSEYIDFDIDFPTSKAITVAQWILENGRGKSKLSQQYNNYGGLKFRPEMQNFAVPVKYEASDGEDIYCSFESLLKFITGYWHFLDRPAYKGWQDHTHLKSLSNYW